MRILSPEEICSKKFMKTSVERSKNLQVRQSYKTVKHVAYEVTDNSKLTSHVVIYKSEKKPPFDWVCDCEWYTTKAIKNAKYCAHILAVHLRLNVIK